MRSTTWTCSLIVRRVDLRRRASGRLQANALVRRAAGRMQDERAFDRCERTCDVAILYRKKGNAERCRKCARLLQANDALTDDPHRGEEVSRACVGPRMARFAKINIADRVIFSVPHTTVGTINTMYTVSTRVSHWLG